MTRKLYMDHIQKIHSGPASDRVEVDCTSKLGAFVAEFGPADQAQWKLGPDGLYDLADDIRYAPSEAAPE
jgi:hypothetical protein